METTTFNVIYNRKKKLLSDGTALVQIEAYLTMRKKYFSTGIYLFPDQWDNKHRKVKNHPNAIKLNRQISDFAAKLQGIELDRRNAKKPYNLDILEEFAKGKITNSFTDFMRNELEADNTLAPATRTVQKTTMKTLQQFKKNIDFEELTFELLTDFERFLYNKGLHTNTINKHFRVIRKYVNLAINKDLFDLNRYPFRKFKPKSEVTTRGFLSTEELQRFENLEIPPTHKHLEKVRDMFLFACYTGLRFSDIVLLNKDNIQTNNDKVELSIIMQKTNEPVKLPLSSLFNGKPIEILNRYTEIDKPCFFGNLTNQYANRCLKEIGSMVGTTKKVTFHMGRHTNGTYLLENGCPVTTIQKLLGHKKLQTTQIYSKVTTKTIENDLQAVKF